MREDVHILVIDDEPAELANFAQMLAAEGWHVQQARSWTEASPYFLARRFDLVIADVRLPDTGFRAMLEAVKKQDKSVYVITTAGYSDIELAMESLKHGANDYISKPFNPADTIISLRKIIERQKLQSDNIQLYETIKSLALALEARDHYTHGHSQEVTDYAVAIAQEMSLSAEIIENIRDAGLLHDIGKIGISDAVLLKPGRLTDAEYRQVKQHPEIGRRILEPVRSLAPKIPFIYHHHERYDGEGYPEGLKAEDIPLGARIIAAADAYQAMTSERPYRSALSEAKAVEELKRNVNKQFDPNVIGAFLRVLERQGVRVK